MLAAVLTNGNYHVRSAHQHCFCGYKYLGNLVDRCDCTRSGSLPYIHSYSLIHTYAYTYIHTYIGDADNNCMEEHEKLLYEETYAETGEYVSCNNCNSDSPWHTYIHTSHLIHTYIHHTSYITPHTYIHTYIHTYTCRLHIMLRKSCCWFALQLYFVNRWTFLCTLIIQYTS